MDRSILVGVAEIADVFGVSRQGRFELARAIHGLSKACSIAEERACLGAPGHPNLGR